VFLNKLDDASCDILLSEFFDTSKARGRIYLNEDRAMIRPENVVTRTIYPRIRVDRIAVERFFGVRLIAEGVLLR